MKTYMKTLIGAMALAVAGSASAITLNGVTWEAGDVTINGGFGTSFFARTDATPVQSGTAAGGVTYNMADNSIYRGAAGTQAAGTLTNTNIGTGNGLFAFGKVATFGGGSTATDLFYIFSGASVQSLAPLPVVGAKGAVTGSLSPFDILFYTLPAGTITNTMTTNCTTAQSNANSPTNCSALLSAVQTAVTANPNALFLQLSSVNQTPTAAFAQYTVKQTGATNAGNNQGLGATQNLSFDNAYFNATGGVAASYFQTQQFEITLNSFADAQQTGSAVLNNSQSGSGSTDPKLYGFNLVLQTNSIPEPGTLALLGFGLMGAGLVGRRRRQAA